jgi:hypothetical protein
MAWVVSEEYCQKVTKVLRLLASNVSLDGKVTYSKVHIDFSRDRDATRVVSGIEKDYRLVCSE